MSAATVVAACDESVGVVEQNAGVQVLEVDRTDDASGTPCTSAAGDCTFRGALEMALTGDLITFNSTLFTTTSPGVIAVTSALPPMSQGTLTVAGGNGYTPIAILDGTSAGAGVDGLTITSSNNIVRGVGVRGFSGHGVVISGASNMLGRSECTDAGGLEVVGNGGFGIAIIGEAADGNTIAANTIGYVRQTGVANGNALGGLLVDGGADNNQVGGSCYGPSIAGNGGPGVVVRGDTTTGTSFQSYTQIGTNGKPNVGAGVWIDGAKNTSMGNTRMEFNTGDGLLITGDTASGNRFVGSYSYAPGFRSNGGLAINLQPAGEAASVVTPNDPGDTDVGPNGLLNFPVIASATGAGGGNVLVTGTACASCTVFVYSVGQAHPSGHGEATSGLAVATANAAGNWSATVAMGPGTSVTAVAIDAAGNMSELAANVMGPQLISVDRTDDAAASACTSAAGDCTFRGALLVARSGDVIGFDSTLFTTTSPGVIAVTSALPSMSQGTLTVAGGNGYTPIAILDGTNAGAGVDGLTIASSNNIVRGVGVRGFSGHGVVISGASNTLGRNECTDAGGLDVVGNGGFGIAIVGEAADGNTIAANTIGYVRQTGAVNGNAVGGILVEGGADNTRIGGSCYGPSIAGNGGPGVVVRDDTTTGTSFQSYTQIGTNGKPNDGAGVWIDGAKNTSMGNTRMEFNTGDGLLITGDTASGNRFVGSYFYAPGFRSNGGLAINLQPAGEAASVVTPNDPGDADVGPNTLLNFPVIRNIESLGAGSFRVTGTACANCTVYVYDAVDGEGTQGFAMTTANSFGVWQTSISYGIPNAQSALTAVAIAAAGNMSELAAPAGIIGFTQVPAICGDGTQDPNEECDDGNTTSGDGCTAACSDEFCGDAILQPLLNEQCDDANTTNNDGCSQSCATEQGYSCTGQPSVCTDINECSTNNGGCAHTCSNAPGSFSCSCNAGYVLNANGLACDDINECSANNGGCAQVCSNSAGSYSCSCTTGYSLGVDGSSCDDINECSTNNGGCAQVCSNSPGSYSCSCNSGYALGQDGTSCTDIDECATNSGGCAQSCSNTVGGFTCGCAAGYTLNNDGHSCDDVDECSTNNGGCAQTCSNSTGSFSCGCTAGYALDPDGHSCNDIDECAANNGGCAQSCSNTAGGFTCSCGSGYTLDADGRGCTDIDECATNNGGCAANVTCTNTPGSFTCGNCPAGYMGDGFTCTDVDECATNNGGCAGTCTNTDGSYTCACPGGFVLDGDGHACVDVDECAADTDNCHANATCANMIGSFTCSCNAGYTGDGVSCADLDECAADLDDCDVNATCTNTPGSFTCACNPGFAGDGTSCFEQRDPPDQGCGCRSTNPPTGALWLVALLALRRRRAPVRGGT